MTLKETTVNQILNAYAKICQELQESGRITGTNLNRLKFIDNCIAGKQETIQELWGNTFVDVYALLDMPIQFSQKRGLMIKKQKNKLEKKKEFKRKQFKKKEN